MLRLKSRTPNYVYYSMTSMREKKVIKGFFKNSQKISSSYYRQKINLPNI